MKLGITTIQKNRGPWIKEWIAFHYLVGFTNFYFFNHQSKDNTKEVLNDLKKHFDIQILDVDPDLRTSQLESYKFAYDNFGHEVDWMAFLDADEFLFPTEKTYLSDVLNDYKDKDISALGIYWAIFGNSDHIEEPKGLIIENFIKRAGRGYANNRHIKSLIKGGQGKKISPADPHFFQTPKGTVDENLRPIASGWTNYEPTYDKLRINHYITQSRSNFLKSKKGTRGPDGGDIRDDAWWIEHNKNDVTDTSMARFIAPLKKLMQEI